jgi:hypothetical protein
MHSSATQVDFQLNIAMNNVIKLELVILLHKMSLQFYIEISLIFSILFLNSIGNQRSMATVTFSKKNWKTWYSLQVLISCDNSFFISYTFSEKYETSPSVPIAQNVFLQYTITVSYHIYQVSGHFELGLQHGLVTLNSKFPQRRPWRVLCPEICITQYSPV